MHVAEKAVQGMTELMEHGLGFIGSEQCRLVGRGLGEVAHDGHHRSHTLAVLVSL